MQGTTIRNQPIGLAPPAIQSSINTHPRTEREEPGNPRDFDEDARSWCVFTLFLSSQPSLTSRQMGIDHVAGICRTRWTPPRLPQRTRIGLGQPALLHSHGPQHCRRHPKSPAVQVLLGARCSTHAARGQPCILNVLPISNMPLGCPSRSRLVFDISEASTVIFHLRCPRATWTALYPIRQDITSEASCEYPVQTMNMAR